MKNSITSITDETFKDVVSKSSNLKEVYEKFGLTQTRTTNRDFKARVKNAGMDVSHLRILYRNRPRFTEVESIDYLYKMLVENSPYRRDYIKDRILKFKLLPYVCEKCNGGPEWNGKKLVLVLDHKNGINNDHRLVNLRFLCPNCNSQEPTFCRVKRRE